jgi:hypothetical protein
MLDGTQLTHMEPTHLKPEDPTIVFHRLNEKFTNNLNSQLKPVPPEMEQVELRARAVSAIGKILHGKHALTNTQKEVCSIFDEVFADLITSVYLAGCALDKPAQMVLRRALELGVATVYLWEQPHIFWGWKECDKDLAFNDMLDHLDSESVRVFVSAVNPAFTADHLFDFSDARRVYRALSNTVHGKIAMFESQIQDRFSANTTDWNTHLLLVMQVQGLLFQLWFNKFSNLNADLRTEIPQVARFI